MAGHVKALAVLHIIVGSIGIIGGLIVLVVLGGIASLIGLGSHDPDAFIAVPILGGIGGFVFLLLLLISVPGIIAGWGLLYFRPWARILTIVLSALHLFHIPLGTALGIYGFWVLLSNEGAALFNAQPCGPVRA